MYTQDILLAMFGLAWFIVGVLAGRVLRIGETRDDYNDDRDDHAGRSGGANGRKGQGIELYVGNLPYKLRRGELEKMFGEHGTVLACRIIQEKGSGKSKGFGFVEMADKRGATEAVRAMNGKTLKGRKLVVNEAESPSH